MRHRRGIRPHETVIGSLGRIEPIKRFDLLIEAFATLRSERPNLRLLIAGEGSQRPILERRARDLGLGSTCRFLGHHADVAELHHAFDVFVQASAYEGTPNVVLEAMAMETPIVATDSGGTGEILRTRLSRGASRFARSRTARALQASRACFSPSSTTVPRRTPTCR